MVVDGKAGSMEAGANGGTGAKDTGSRTIGSLYTALLPDSGLEESIGSIVGSPMGSASRDG